jgi:cytochrome c
MSFIKFVVTASITAGFMALAAAPAHASEELATKNACGACHKVDKKLVGPSYKEIAIKYAKEKDAETKLAEKVKKGSVGVWGQVPMPANAHVKDEDIKAIVKWIMTTNADEKK